MCFILKSNRGKKIEYAGRMRRMMRIGTAACLINTASESVQLLQQGSTPSAAVSQ